MIDACSHRKEFLISPSQHHSSELAGLAPSRHFLQNMADIWGLPFMTFLLTQQKVSDVAWIPNYLYRYGLEGNRKVKNFADVSYVIPFPCVLWYLARIMYLVFSQKVAKPSQWSRATRLIQTRPSNGPFLGSKLPISRS